jgi:hypothetical protein
MEINQGFFNGLYSLALFYLTLRKIYFKITLFYSICKANLIIAITICLLCNICSIKSEIYEINKNVIGSQRELGPTTQFVEASTTTLPLTNRNRSNKLRYQELWYETNDSAVLNCTLRVNKDQHVNKLNFELFIKLNVVFNYLSFEGNLASQIR